MQKILRTFFQNFYFINLEKFKDAYDIPNLYQEEIKSLNILAKTNRI